MASQDELIQKSIDGALAEIKKFAPDHFAKLEANPSKKAEIIKAARDNLTMHLKLAAEHPPTGNEAEHLAKHLPKHRVELIKKGLQVPTYRLDITKKADGHHWVDITRDGAEFMPSKKLDTTAAVDATSWLQMASIIVEAVLLVLNAVGVEIPDNAQVIKTVAKKIVDTIEKSLTLQKDIQALEDAAKSGSSGGVAKAIFVLIGDCFKEGILWEIIKGLCVNMSWWDWTQTAVVVTAEIIAAIATDGGALVVEIIVAVKDAVQLMGKLTNLAELRVVKKNL